VFGGIGCTAWWWLRSPGNNQNNAANVNNDGNVNLNGNNVNNETGGVRPALLPTPEACRKRGGLRGGVKGTGFPLAPKGHALWGGKIKAGGGGDAVKNLLSGPGEGRGRPRLPPVRRISWR